MAAFHPNLRMFGQLELLEVYDFQDTPLFVSCRNPSGSLYFAVAIHGPEGSDAWLYVQVSCERFMNVRSGAMDLHTAFSQPESGFTFLVVVPEDEAIEASVQPMTPNELDDNILPTRGEFLRLPAETLPNQETAEALSRRTLRDIVGKLVGANIDKKTFEVWSLDKEGQHYAGRIADDAVETVKGAVIGNTYRAFIVQVEKLKPAGDMAKETILLQLGAAGEAIQER